MFGATLTDWSALENFTSFTYCMEAGFPAPLTDALLALIDDPDLLSDALDAWNASGVGNKLVDTLYGVKRITNITDAVYEITDERCLFCEDCKDLVWRDDATRIANGDWVCDENCLDDYSKCTYCEEWSDETTDVSGRNYCESCLQNECSYCESCNEWVSETDSVDEIAYCESCLSNYCTYCEDCDEYRRDDDDDHNHNEGCDCEAPHFSFKFPADGHGLVRQDERLTVELPAGTIDEQGILRIKRLLKDNLGWEHNYTVAAAIDSIGPLWQAKRGNFTRRLSSALYKQGIKLEPSVVSEVGNIAQAHSSKGATWHIEFTRDLNQSAESFYHDGSCWWGSHAVSRCCLKSWGGIGLRTYRDTDSSSDYPTGRIWVQPLSYKGETLRPTHNAEGADAYVVFNGYGALSGYVAARIVAHLTGRTYRQINLTAESMYVNGDVGWLVADEATCDDTESLGFYFDEHDNQDAYTYNRQEAA